MLGPDQYVLSHNNRKWNSSYIISCLVSLLSVFFTQITLSLLPVFLPALSYPCLLPLAVLLLVSVVGFGRLCKRIAGVRASALAYVFFTIFFIWAVYFFVVRLVISSLMDLVLNLEITMLLIGLCCIISVDPGYVTHHSPSNDQYVQSPLSEVEAQGEGFEVHRRVRYCRHCQKYVAGFDHHCPAFGTCIGQRNHPLFMVLLVGFIMCEASFVACASLFHRIQVTAETRTLNKYLKANASRNLVAGTMLFCLIQVLWQVVFTMWHVYCACFNIKTDEWINWKKYPEFQIKATNHAGESHGASTQFTNPYDKGILRNLKEFLIGKG